MNTRYVTIKDITACNGFGFKGVGDYSLSMWLFIPLIFPLFPQVFFMTGRSGFSNAETEVTLA